MAQDRRDIDDRPRLGRIKGAMRAAVGRERFQKLSRTFEHVDQRTANAGLFLDDDQKRKIAKVTAKTP